MAARELFRLGTEDADAGRFTDALEKFKRVAAVKETAAVRFNIARCEEALGRTGTALADFELAEREGGQDSKAAEDVARLAKEHADALRPHVPRLTVVPPAATPDGMAVTVDGGKLASATLAVGLPVDPGYHVVEATAPGRSPFHSELTVVGGEMRRVVLLLPPHDRGTPDKPASEHPQPASSSQEGWGWITIAAGGALAIGSSVFLVLHNNAVANLNADCPNLHCNPADQPQIESRESTARMYEGASIGLLAAGALAIGGGIVLITTAPRSAPAAVTVTTGAPGAPAGLSLHGSF